MVGGHPVPASALQQAVVPIGDCTGVLIATDRVLTSAHCLKPSLDEVTIAGQALRLAGCEPHPGYLTLQAPHDLALCRLAAPAPVAGIALDDGPSPESGQAVTLAGYGLPAAMAHVPAMLRAVDTDIVRVEAETFDIGTADHTACLGDSGGPVLVERGGVFRVAGILHGPSGAVCASPVRAVRLDASRDWLARDPESDSTMRSASSRLAVPFVVAALGIAVWGWARRRRGRHAATL
jgi:hypothetical protein